jgi:hypothetical protein
MWLERARLERYNNRMKTGFRVILFSTVLLIPFFLSQASSPVPEILLRPQNTNEPIFPRDYVIGELGRGGASEEAYQNASLALSSLVYGGASSPGIVISPPLRNKVRPVLSALGVRTYRIGGGRNESDGSVSFLIRFLGRSQSITGELYLRRSENPPSRTERVMVSGALDPQSAEPEDEITIQPAAPAIAEQSAIAPAAETTPEVTAAVTGIVTTGEAAATDVPALMVLWELDDILLEDQRPLTEGKYSPGSADMTSYERFF